MPEEASDKRRAVITAIEPGLRFARDNVIGFVAAIATLFYGFSEYVNKQQVQEKTFIDQFASAVEKFAFPQDCKDATEKHKVYLQSAMFAAGKLQDVFDNEVYLQIIQPLSNRYIEFEAGCEHRKVAADPQVPEELKESRQQRAIAGNNIKIKEIAQQSTKGASWYTVVASFSEGKVEEAADFACKLRAAKPELGTRPLQIYSTKVSRSTAVVIDGPKDSAGAMEVAQALRSKYIVPDAFSQVDRDWKLERTVTCPA